MATEWFYWSGGRQRGPVDEAHLKQRAEAGTLRPEDLIWNAAMKDWRPAGEATDWRFGPAPVVAALPGTPPAPTLAYAAQSDEQLILSPRVIDLLGRTGPWVRFLAVLSYIAAGLFLVGGALLVGMTLGGVMPQVSGVGVGGFYVLMGVLYVFPGMYLNSYASRIRTLKRMRRNVDMEQAIDAQRAFWKFCGIAAMLCIVLYFVFVLVAVAFGIWGR
jgi:hypothetical protein